MTTLTTTISGAYQVTEIVVTTSTYTVANITNPFYGQTLVVIIKNSSGGALTVTWSAGYSVDSWVNPASGSSRGITFYADAASSLYQQIGDYATSSSANLTGPITSVGNATTIVGPIPAVSLSGTISGAGNQINNVVIGTTTPLAGSFTSLSANALDVTGSYPTSGATTLVYSSTGTVPSGTTSIARVYSTNISIAASTTVTSVQHFYAQGPALFSGAVVTNQYGFLASGTLSNATNNYGFYGGIAAGTNRYNLYMSGTAANYLEGTLTVNGGISGGTTLGVTGVSSLLGGAVVNSATTNFTQKFQSISSTGQSNAMFFKTVANSTGVDITLGKSRNASSDPTAFTAVQNGDTLAVIGFAGTDGSALATNASISSIVDAVVSAGTVPTSLVFVTGTATGGTNRLAISSLGVLSIYEVGTAPSSSPAGLGQLYVQGGALKYRGSGGTVTTIAAA
jgi:hypothetical protein